MSDITYEVSPYIDSSPEPSPVAEVKEQFYTEQEVNHISKLFTDNKKHLAYLFKLYKFIQPIIQPRKKPIYEMTEEDVLKDVMSTTSYSLDMDSLAEGVTKDVSASMFGTELFNKQIECVPLFIDFAYMYYVRHFCDDAPVLKLPTFMPKYKLIMSTLKVPYDELYACFEQCIENSIIAEMRQEIPPYHLRTDLSEPEIREKMKILVLPLCKDILKHLLDLGYTKKIQIREPTGPYKSPDTTTITARVDNLEEQVTKDIPAAELTSSMNQLD